MRGVDEHGGRIGQAGCESRSARAPHEHADEEYIQRQIHHGAYDRGDQGQNRRAVEADIHHQLLIQAKGDHEGEQDPSIADRGLQHGSGCAEGGHDRFGEGQSGHRQDRAAEHHHDDAACIVPLCVFTVFSSEGLGKQGRAAGDDQHRERIDKHVDRHADADGRQHIRSEIVTHDDRVDQRRHGLAQHRADGGGQQLCEHRAVGVAQIVHGSGFPLLFCKLSDIHPQRIRQARCGIAVLLFCFPVRNKYTKSFYKIGFLLLYHAPGSAVKLNGIIS